MLLSLSHRFLFIHVYKVAGTSVTTALQPYALQPKKLLVNRVLGKINRLLGTRLCIPHHRYRVFRNHPRALDMKNLLPAGVFDSCFKFAFVRNPWDWQVSLYYYMLKNAEHFQHELVKKMSGFDEYLDWRVNSQIGLQKDFLVDQNGTMLMDYVGRFETLNEDFKQVCRKLNLNLELPYLNQSGHRDYRSYYTPRTRDLIATHFRPDIEMFGYSFDSDMKRAG